LLHVDFAAYSTTFFIISNEGQTEPNKKPNDMKMNKTETNQS